MRYYSEVSELIMGNGWKGIIIITKHISSRKDRDMATKISWTNETWNPVVGCSKVSAGCLNCYAERMACRLAHMDMRKYQDVTDGDVENWFREWNGETFCDEKALTKPLHWRNPRKIFVCSMGDLFHESVPFEFVAQVTDIIRKCPQHTFQILTKRSQQMHNYFHHHMQDHYPPEMQVLPNLWLGVTAESQEMADKRIPILLQTPAAKRFVSIEPMLGEIKLNPECFGYTIPTGDFRTNKETGKRQLALKFNPKSPNLDLVICGGESGPGARPMHPDWARSLRDQCEAAGVPFYFKQWGEWLPIHQTEWSHCTMTDRKTKEGEPIYELYDLNDTIIATGITEEIEANKGAWIRCVKKKAGHLLDGKEHRQEF